MKKKKSINCGDWSLGWGYGGHDKVGRMTIGTNENGEAVNEFHWKGESNGRHGTRWNHGASCLIRFSGVADIQVIKSTGSIPVKNELLKCAIYLADMWNLDRTNFKK